jgi:hypothetical protein
MARLTIDREFLGAFSELEKGARPYLNCPANRGKVMAGSTVGTG